MTVIFLGALLAACGSQTPQAATAPAVVVATVTTAPTSTVPAIATVPAPTAVPSRPAPASTAAPTAAPTLLSQVVSTAPDCTVALTTTPAQTEGPFFKAGSPERASLVEPGTAGSKVTLTGFVLTTDCKPVSRALLDFWQADDKGSYDNAGYRLRGHVFTDANGRYSIETIMPGLYTGRTRHIHVKVQAPNQPVLTTQLYFPGETSNQNDSIFNRALLVTMQNSGASKLATFNFFLSVSH